MSIHWTLNNNGVLRVPDVLALPSIGIAITAYNSIIIGDVETTTDRNDFPSTPLHLLLIAIRLPPIFDGHLLKHL